MGFKKYFSTDQKKVLERTLYVECSRIDLCLDGPRPSEPGLHRDPGAHGPHHRGLLADGLGAGQRGHSHALQVSSSTAGFHGPFGPIKKEPLVLNNNFVFSLISVSVKGLFTLFSPSLKGFPGTEVSAVFSLVP